MSKPIQLHLPSEVVIQINKFMSSPSSVIKYFCVPVSNLDWDDYDRCLQVHKRYKLLCYIKKTEPMPLVVNWTSEDYELFLHVYSYI
jgi:hypothetical protein